MSFRVEPVKSKKEPSAVFSVTFWILVKPFRHPLGRNGTTALPLHEG